MTKIATLSSFGIFVLLIGAPTAEAGPFYIKTDIGISKLKEFCSSPATGYTCTDISPAITLDGGYELSDNFGLELGYGMYGSAKTSGPLLSSTLEVTENISGLRLAGTATLPVSSIFAFTGRLGVARNQLTVNSTLSPGAAIPSYTATSTSLTYGAGVRFKLGKFYRLYVQYENLGKVGDETIGTDNLSLLTVGFSYNFGKPTPTVVASKPAPVAQPPVVSQPVKNLPVLRAIIFLAAPPPEGRQQLSIAVAAACQCKPEFVRMYSSTAVVYQISLPPGQSFTSFNRNLLSGNASLGVKAVMQTQ